VQEIDIAWSRSIIHHITSNQYWGLIRVSRLAKRTKAHGGRFA